jgi:hypothetical protein
VISQIIEITILLTTDIPGIFESPILGKVSITKRSEQVGRDSKGFNLLVLAGEH